MLSVEVIERMLVNGIVTGARIAEPVDVLLGHLLSRRAGYASRATAGVMFAHELVSKRQFDASGVVVMIDQTIEPLRVELVLDLARSQLVSGRVCFGDSSRTVGYGTAEHGKLRDHFLVEPNAEFPWKERFLRGEDGWQHDGR